MRDLSFGGLFIQTSKPRPAGVPVRLDFLVQEGQIRAEAVVRYVLNGAGLGLKFMALNEQDRPRLAALLARLRSFSHSRRKI